MEQDSDMETSERRQAGSGFSGLPLHLRQPLVDLRETIDKIEKSGDTQKQRQVLQALGHVARFIDAAVADLRKGTA